MGGQLELSGVSRLAAPPPFGRPRTAGHVPLQVPSAKPRSLPPPGGGSVAGCDCRRNHWHPAPHVGGEGHQRAVPLHAQGLRLSHGSRLLELVLLQHQRPETRLGPATRYPTAAARDRRREARTSISCGCQPVVLLDEQDTRLLLRRLDKVAGAEKLLQRQVDRSPSADDQLGSPGGRAAVSRTDRSVGHLQPGPHHV